jgi:hypothetical protein
LGIEETMTTIARKLDEKMKEWDPEKALWVERIVDEIIQLADEDQLELLRSRAVEHEVMDIIDEA